MRRVVQPILTGASDPLMADDDDFLFCIEIKLVHPKRGRETTLEMGLDQIARYDDTIRADSLHLVIFDRRPEYRAKPWEERLAREARTTAAGKPVTVIWC